MDIYGNEYPVTNSDIQQAKDNVNDTNGKSKTVIIIIVITILLLLVFMVALIVFFLIGNSTAKHQIIVFNNCSQPVYVLVGTEVIDSDNLSFQSLEPKIVAPGAVVYYYATPSAYVVVQGYYGNTLSENTPYPYPLTKLKLWLAGQDFTGTPQITDNTTILNVPRSNNNSDDIYDVSLQDGFNIQIGITSTANNNRNNNDPFSCVGPTWNYIITGTGPNACPNALKYPGSTGYRACISACLGTTGDDQILYCCAESDSCGISGGCQNEWPNYDYYTIFSEACPNCMITNCDLPIFECGSKNGLTQYTITFCP